MATTANNDMGRREVLTTVALGGAALLGSCTGAASASAEPRRLRATNTTGAPIMSNTAALAGKHEPVPLPFAPGSLNGLSERLITSHHENNYGGAVKNLNRVEQELSKLSSDTPPFVVGALRERELTFRNSKTFHEAYFGNLGGNGNLGLELDTGALRTFWSGNHTQVLATSVPLLVVDMYEHSYHIDFGATAARYIDAFFANVNWDEVNRRFERARRMSAIYRGVPS